MYILIIECQNVRSNLSNTVMVSSSSSISTEAQVFDLSLPWCASGPVPQIVTLHFNKLVYLTQLLVTGNSINVSNFLDGSQMPYNNTVGFSVSSPSCVFSSMYMFMCTSSCAYVMYTLFMCRVLDYSMILGYYRYGLLLIQVVWNFS